MIPNTLRAVLYLCERIVLTPHLLAIVKSYIWCKLPLKFARIYERCRMEQLGGWELAHIAAHAANRR